MRNLIVGLAWLAPFAAIVIWPHSAAAAIGIVALSHALLLYPTLRSNVQWLGPVITRFDTNAREVWLTIDDGPTDDTPALLELLKRLDVQATFFLKGKLTTPEIVRTILDGGHTIGNHSQTHPSATFWCLPAPWIANEIDGCNGVLGKQTYFRAPVGMKNPAVHPLLTERGMILVGWTARGFDTVRADPERISTRILSSIEPGAIIVMHQGRPHSLACIERVIVEVRSAGYAFVVPAGSRLNANR
jgi:peptidoglycan/xylan/chitin deacetylase (PgdA/CDA1 family)